MPDILTRGDNVQRQLATVEQCIRSLLLPDSAVATATRKQIAAEYGLAAIASLRTLLSGNGSPDRENASERNLTQSSGLPEPPATPETIRISLSALRAVVLGLIDDGDEANSLQKSQGVSRVPWFFYLNPAPADIEMRLRFCDELERRLRQLPARG